MSLEKIKKRWEKITDQSIGEAQGTIVDLVRVIELFQEFNDQCDRLEKSLDERESKKKVKRWLWGRRENENYMWATNSTFYTEKEAKYNYKNYQLQKLEWSETEFDE